MLRALLWDVDGTLAETERDGHLVAFNQAFRAMDVPWRWDERRYGQLLSVAGGRERLLHDMDAQPLAPETADDRHALAESLHRLKNERYARIVAAGGIRLREGVRSLMNDCQRERLPMGIVTTTSRANLQALMAAQPEADWASRFAVIVCGEDAPLKKPDPQAYIKALQALSLAPDEVLAIEDSPAGVASAHAAGVPVVVTRSHYFPAPPPAGVVAHGPSLGRGDGWQPQPGKPRTARIDLEQLASWHGDAYPKRSDRSPTTRSIP